MEEPAELVCWRMELVKISHKELELLGEGEILVKFSPQAGFEHLIVSPEKKLWWNSENERWKNFDSLDDYIQYITRVKEIYLIVDE